MLATWPRAAAVAEARRVAQLLALVLTVPGTAKAWRVVKALLSTFVDSSTTQAESLAAPRSYVAWRASKCLAAGVPLNPASWLRPAKAHKA